jgi:predicted ThiF/HesA family dinucleotide-utilizing enzyme
VLELVTRQLAQLIKRLGICQINMVKKTNGVMGIGENKYGCCVIKAVAARHGIEEV